jgi:hypothetical protein
MCIAKLAATHVQAQRTPQGPAVRFTLLGDRCYSDFPVGKVIRVASPKGEKVIHRPGGDLNWFLRKVNAAAAKAPVQVVVSER